MAYDTSQLDRVDRILVGACAGIWLLALGAGVAATVALVDLAGGQPEPTGESGTPWLLYTVIGISAAVIIGAVPLLVRARRDASDDAHPPAPAAARPAAGAPPPPARGVEAPTEKLRVSATDPGRYNRGPGYTAPWTHGAALPAALVAAIDQVWFRCAVVIACAIGVAMVLIGAATYLMAIDSNGAAWVFYVLAGLVTLAMPAVPWLYLNELSALLDEPAAVRS